MLDSSHLVSTLLTLPFFHRLAFAASCCERLVPNYSAFVLSQGFGDMKLADQVLQSIWRAIEEQKIEEQQIHQLVQACEEIVPDTENSTSIFTGAAINALAALIYTMQSSLDRDPDRIAQVAQLVIDANDEYLHIVNAPGIEPYEETADLEEWIRQSPLMVSELEKQRQDINILQSNSELTGEVLRLLQQSSRKIGIHPIRRGLVPIPTP